MQAPEATLGHDAEESRQRPADSARAQLLTGIPVSERRRELAGISTAILEGGEGPPLVLLHGPGESAANWRWVLPRLSETHQVVAPDLPAHGATEAPEGLDGRRALAWLGALLESCCDGRPAVVGHVLGGSLAARFAIESGDRLGALVLVDSLGLARFRPLPAFALGLIGFMTRPNERSYERFMRQCAFDLEDLQARMAGDWAPFASYNLELARRPAAKIGGRLLREAGLPRIPSEELARIAVSTTLIWGRHDRANRLAVAEAASERFGWPLHVIEDSADDPPRDQPEAFLRALYAALPPAESGTHPKPIESGASSRRREGGTS